MNLDERIGKLAQLIEEVIADTSEPAIVKAQMLKTHCDSMALEEILFVIENAQPEE